jgi:hypothetical protein
VRTRTAVMTALLFLIIVIAWVPSPSASLSQQVSIITLNLHFFGPIVSTSTDLESAFPYWAFGAGPQDIKDERSFAEGAPASIRINDTAGDIKCAEYRLGLQLRQCLLSPGRRLLLSNIKNAFFVLKFNVTYFALYYFVCTYNQGADLVYSTLFIGENNGLQMFQVFPIRIILKYCAGLVACRTRSRVLFCQRQLWVDFPAYIDAFGGRMPHILRAEFKTYHHAGIFNDEIKWIRCGQSDPRSLSNIQLSELVPHEFQLVGGSLVAAFTCGPHFDQLAAHNVNLLGDLLIGAAQGAPLQSANDDSNSREERYRDCGMSGKASRAIWGDSFVFWALRS